MDNLRQDQLGPAFRQFLESGLDPAAAESLAGPLRRAGRLAESEALETSLRQGVEPFRFTAGPWMGWRCVADTIPPAIARPGDLWFDLVEMSLMTLTPDPRDPRMEHPRHAALPAWIATSPVAVWQFRAFLGLVRVGDKRTEFASPEDYLAPGRWAEAPALAAVTDVYQDEADAYARWFGKSLCGPFELEGARASLPPAAFARLLPARLSLWDVAEHPDSEFLRMAYGADTFERELEGSEAEAALLSAGVTPPSEGRVLFREWERSGDIGLALSLPRIAAEFPDGPRHTLFFDIDNAAPRPTLGGRNG